MGEMFKDNIVPDYGWHYPPVRTKKPCSNPDFADHNLHRVAIMKNEHFGSPGDRDERGLPGWTAKLICNGCKREFNKDGFYPEIKQKELCAK